MIHDDREISAILLWGQKTQDEAVHDDRCAVLLQHADPGRHVPPVADVYWLCDMDQRHRTQLHQFVRRWFDD